MGAYERVKSDWALALLWNRQAALHTGEDAAAMKRAALKYARRVVIIGGNVQVPARRKAQDGRQTGLSGAEDCQVFRSAT